MRAILIILISLTVVFGRIDPTIQQLEAQWDADMALAHFEGKVFLLKMIIPIITFILIRITLSIIEYMFKNKEKK